MKLSWRIELPQLLIIAGLFAVAGWAWPHVPDRMPIHWNIRGEVDGWGGKFAGLLLLPIIVVGIYLLTLAVPLIDPGRSNYKNFAKAFGLIRIGLMLFFSLIYVVSVLTAFGYSINMTMIVFPAVGVLFVVLGNVMSKIRPNWFVGVRTPWTLSSRLSWDKTHRLAGWLFIVMGLLFFALALAPNGRALIAVLSFDAICIVGTIVYSYFIYRCDPNPMPPAGTLPSGD